MAPCLTPATPLLSLISTSGLIQIYKHLKIHIYIYTYIDIDILYTYKYERNSISHSPNHQCVFRAEDFMASKFTSTNSASRSSMLRVTNCHQPSPCEGVQQRPRHEHCLASPRNLKKHPEFRNFFVLNVKNTPMTNKTIDSSARPCNRKAAQKCPTLQFAYGF